MPVYNRDLPGLQSGANSVAESLFAADREKASQAGALQRLIKGEELKRETEKADLEAKQKTLEDLAAKFPGRSVSTEKLGLGAPQDPALKQAAQDARKSAQDSKQDAQATAEAGKVGQYFHSLAAKDIDALKSSEEVKRILADPSVTNMTQLRMQLARAASQGRINQYEVEHIAGPETLKEMASSGLYKLFGKDVMTSPITEATRQNLINNYDLKTQPLRQNVQKAWDATQKWANTNAPTLARTGRLKGTLEANYGPIDSIMQDTDPAGLRASPAPGSLPKAPPMPGSAGPGPGAGGGMPPGMGTAAMSGAAPSAGPMGGGAPAAATSSKPTTVTQGGHTYTLNPQTGQYE